MYRGYLTPPIYARDGSVAILGGKKHGLQVFGRASLAMSVGRKYSGYYQQLEDDVKNRYNDKLNSIGVEVDDPYTFSSGHILMLSPI